jgi:hypothetical protein
MRDTCRFPLLRFSFRCLPGLFFEIFGQAIERFLPEPAIFIHPARSLPERFGIDSHFVNASITCSPKQPGLFQHAQVFRDSRKRHGVRFREVCHTLIAPREMSEDPPPGGIGQSGERAIQVPRRIFNHLVKY